MIWSCTKKKKKKEIDAQARKSILIQVNEMRRDRKSPKIQVIKKDNKLSKDMLSSITLIHVINFN